MSGSLRNWIKVRFITGFFVTVPAIASSWLLYVFWDAIDKFFSPGYERLFGRIELLFTRVPIFRSIYPSIKQLIESFSPEKRQSFKAVVLAEHPREGEFVFGFVTSEVVVETPAGKREMVTVFVPTNNLYLGDVIMLPRKDVITTGLTVEEGIRVILSAGTATPARLPRERL